jgi:threonine dehydratase
VPESGAGDHGSLDDHLVAVAEAAATIAPHVRRTPLLETELDPDLRLKAECLQVTGSFKARGAFNAVLRLVGAHPNTEGVIAVSSGNHAQAVALAARTVGRRAVIVIPEGANPAKVQATMALGAEVIQEGVTMANRDDLASRLAAERGLAFVHPFDDWHVIHGQGTAAREALEDDPQIGAVVAPIGGGGLLSGTALAARSRAGRPVVIGVEPEVADDATRTFRTGHIQRLAAPADTIADGVRTVAIGQRPFQVLVRWGLAGAMVTVTEEEIARAARVAWTRLKLALEPSGALPLAAHLSGKLAPHVRPGRPVALILSGGNADPQLMAEILAGSL